MARAKAEPRQPGRLPASESEALHAHVLDAAQAAFIKESFAHTTIEAIARAAGVTRKTVYARYAGKEELLAAVIERLRQIAPLAPALAPRNMPLNPRKMLLKIAYDLIAIAETPVAAGVGRLFYAEAFRSPPLRQALEEMRDRAVQDIRLTLDPLHAAGHLPLMPDANIAASIFLEMTVSRARAAAMLGEATPRKWLIARTEAAVDIFLRGCGYEH